MLVKVVVIFCGLILVMYVSGELLVNGFLIDCLLYVDDGELVGNVMCVVIGLCYLVNQWVKVSVLLVWQMIFNVSFQEVLKNLLVLFMLLFVLCDDVLLLQMLEIFVLLVLFDVLLVVLLLQGDGVVLGGVLWLVLFFVLGLVLGLLVSLVQGMF